VYTGAALCMGCVWVLLKTPLFCASTTAMITKANAENNTYFGRVVIVVRVISFLLFLKKKKKQYRTE
jgi:hypothetical protein